MKVQNCLIENNSVNKNRKNTPNFKAGIGDIALNTVGNSMQWIQDKGFLASFLIQDTLGMTVPRTAKGFLRDKEVTGQYNMQEGFEVIGREGLTGPIMMAVAPIMMGLAAYCGKSTSVNSQFIKRYGNSLKEFITSPEFKNELLGSKDKFRDEFYRKNIRDILNNTIGKDRFNENSIETILKELNKYQNIPQGAKKGKVQAEAMNNIVEHINSLKYETSSDLSLLDRVKLGSEVTKDIKTFSTRDAFDGLMKYVDDAITNNKAFDQMNAEMAENIKNNAFAKRFITNISTMAATLGVMSILPKIYAKSDISPSERIAQQMQEAHDAQRNGDNDTTKNDDVSFKGKGGNASSWLTKFGKWLSEKSTGKYASELEYNGHNFTNTLMAGLSLGGLLAPRGYRAVKRAPQDENGKKDLSELYEILTRDIASSLSVVFLVPMLTRACVTSYEKNSGFVLMHKDRSSTGLKTALDLINPYSSTHVLSNNEIRSLYDGIDSTAKMLNFCKYIDNNGGDLEKIISKSDSLKELESKLPKLSGLSRKAKNAKLTEFFEELGKNKDANKIIEKLMKGIGEKRNNKILSFARGLNSIPAFLVTVLISPYVLGWFIPGLTYSNTRKRQEKAIQEKEAKLKIANA